MEPIVNLLFEARLLKTIFRTGYPFLGSGKESVASHSFLTAFIAYVMAKMEPSVDGMRLVTMCLIHDLPEARIGDLNYVHKQYVFPDEEKAVRHMTADLSFGPEMADLIRDFNQGETREALLARDADQIAFLLDLKALKDVGYLPPEKWFSSVEKRLRTEIGKKICASIREIGWDQWWQKKFIDSSEGTN